MASAARWSGLANKTLVEPAQAFIKIEPITSSPWLPADPLMTVTGRPARVASTAAR